MYSSFHCSVPLLWITKHVTDDHIAADSSNCIIRCFFTEIKTDTGIKAHHQCQLSTSNISQSINSITAMAVTIRTGLRAASYMKLPGGRKTYFYYNNTKWHAYFCVCASACMCFSTKLHVEFFQPFNWVWSLGRCREYYTWCRSYGCSFCGI